MLFVFLEFFSQTLAFFVVVPLVLGVGAYFTFRLRFIQVTHFVKGVLALTRTEKGSQGNISHFQAIATVLAGNLGTGNISGMAVAITTGGPGSLFWMWIMAFFGAILKYAGCLLGVKYRHRNEAGEYVGGPMYYLLHGAKVKWLAALFSLFAIASAFTVGNLVQVNSVSLPLESLGFSPLAVGIASAVVVALILFGTIERVATVAAVVVPLMATLYVALAVTILFFNSDKIADALFLLFSSAFDFTAVSGGFLGFGIFKAMGSGFERAVFATDAGVGIAPVLQSSARTKSPVVEGLVAMVAPVVVMVISTLTGLVLLVTGAWEQECLRSTTMCTWAFSEGLGSIYGTYIVTICLIFFALTTVLAWGYCAERAVEYLFGLEYVKLFQYLYVVAIPIGALAYVDMAWQLADVCLIGMLVTNVVGLLLLSSKVFEESAAQ